MADKYTLALDVEKVKECMQEREFSYKYLGEKVGWKDPHTLSRYLAQPEKIKLCHVAAISAALSPALYPEDFITRIKIPD